MDKVRPGSLPFPAFADQPLECLRCGYDLRGLTRPERCPECGAPAATAQGAETLLTAGVAVTEFGRPGRTVAMIGTLAGWGIMTQPVVWFVFIGMGMFWLAVALLLALIGVSVWLIVTRPRRSSTIERLVFTRGGVGRAAWRSWRPAGFIEWTRDEHVHIKSVSTVWQKLIIQRPTESGRAAKIIEFGFRCRREHVGLVKQIVEAMVMESALPDGARETLTQDGAWVGSPAAAAQGDRTSGLAADALPPPT